jgi:glycosyltransferase involved in cell wall biosynthesis
MGSIGALVLGMRLKRDLNKFILDERLFVLPNAIPDINPEAVKFGRNNKGPVKILFLSNLIPSKGPMEFLYMAKKVVDKCKKKVRFILAGPIRSEAFFEDLKEFIRKKGLTDFVTISGGVYGADKEDLLRESDIFVFPSYKEAFGLVNLEAMQRGLPVISSNEGAIPEVIQDGVSGYIVAPKNIDQLADRVLKLVNNPELRKNMGKAGRRRYEKLFTIEAYEKRVDEAVKFFDLCG